MALLTEVTRKLPVALSDAEVADRVREAKTRTETVDTLSDKLVELAAQTKATKGDIEHEQREITRLVRVAEAREEPRDVKCRWTYDLESNAATLVRSETNVLVEARALSAQERNELEQKPLFEETETQRPRHVRDEADA
jgi:hypothetical protein